ncbi:MAG: DUF5916 domain-containing protein [Aquimonas sp.]|nr:DUF5916 domain-containing protein [Aquimonas sp.]
MHPSPDRHRSPRPSTAHVSPLSVNRLGGRARPAIWKPSWLAALLLIVCWSQAAAGTSAVIRLDGRLDEPEWAQAQTIEDFRVVSPLTRATPPVRTELRVLALPEGLYIGVRAEQPAQFARTRHPTRRDAQARADRINLIIDFEGEGSTAYEFTITLSGGIQDAVISGQNRFSYDWDGVWDYAIDEDADGWAVELRLPWGIAPLGRVEDGRTRIGLYASRVLEQAGLRFSHPHYNFDHPTFVADMARLEIPAWGGLRAEVVPYVAVALDRLADSREQRVGADFYLAQGGHRLNATLRPDFGQVESDALVVDFGAVEIFFGDKRPFFTENQSLFEVPLGNGALLLNTRRIGARPDLGPEGVSEVAGALKYTAAVGSRDIGLLFAQELDSSAALGREFRMLRGRQRHARGEFGLSLTEAIRPSIDRQARTAALDAQWRPRDGMQLRSALARSEVDDPRRPADPGHLLWLRLDHQPSAARWRQEHELMRHGRGLDLNDLGFLPRSDFSQARSRFYWFTRSWPDSPHLRDTTLEGQLLYRRNGDGERLSASAELLHSWRFEDASQLRLRGVAQAAFTDDLVLRGNGVLQLPARRSVDLRYTSPRMGAFGYEARVESFQEGLSGRAHVLQFSPYLYLGERFTSSLRYDRLHSPDWLNWDGGAHMARYARVQQQFDWTVEWFPAPRHELRLRAQHVGLRAAGRERYAVAAGQLLASGDAVDFSLSRLAAQLRYRYDLGPQRDFYLVLARGGAYDGADDEAERLGRLFDRARANETANQILAKLRWGF